MRLRSFLLKTAVSLVITWQVAGLTGPAAAQTPAPLATEEVSEEILITARRVTERLQDVPIAVSAFSEETLQGLETKDLGDLQGLVPNLNIAQGRGSNSSANVFIRGVGQPDALATFDPAVGIYVDDVFLSRIRGALVDIYDVARVEVLRGPQGTLYGKNTEGGAIRLVTKAPNLQEFEIDGALGVGSFNGREVSFNARGPILKDRLGFKAAFQYKADDGYIFDPLAREERNGSRSLAGRVSLLGQFGPKFTSRIDLDVLQENADLQLGRAVNRLFQADLAPAFGLALPPGVPAVRLVPGFAVPASGEFNFEASSTPGLPNRIDLLHWGAALVNTLEISPALTLKSVSSYRELTYEDFIDIDATRFELGDVFVGVDQSQVSQEFQLLLRTERVNGVFGLFYLNELIRSDQASFNGDAFFFLGLPAGFDVFIDDRQELDSFAAFFQTDTKLTQKLSITLGLRATYEEKDFTVFSRDTVFRLPASNPRPLITRFSGDGSANFFDLSPRVSLNYHPSRDVLAYVSYAQGFKSGGFNGRATAAAALEPFSEEKVNTVEIGVKSSWLANRLVGNVTGFYNQYRDFQASVPGVAEDGLTAVNSVFNAGRLRQLGFEFEGIARPLAHLEFTGSIGFLDAQYSQFFARQRVGGVFVDVDLSNRIPAFSPRWTARAAGAYTIPTQTFGDFSVLVQGAYRGDSFLTVETEQAPLLNQPNFWLLDAFFTWKAPQSRVSLTAGVKNITDEVYAVDSQNFTTVAGIQTLYFAPPRTWSVTANFKF